MNPHWQNIDNETPEDWMWPLSLFRNPSLIRQHRRWRADVPTRDSIASILDDVAQSLEPWCVLSWRPASLSNAIMDPPRQCFQYPPLSIDSPEDSNPETSYHLTRCMPLKCSESIRAQGSRPATSYVHYHRYGGITLGISKDNNLIRMGVHRFVCFAFKGPPLHQSHVCMHLCGDSTCLNPYHLAWGSQQQNITHSNQPRSRRGTGRFVKKR